MMLVIPFLSMSIRELFDILFPPVYWKMKDTELERLSPRYGIPPLSRAGKEGEHWYVDRERIIKGLTDRDAALRARISNSLSILALIVSIASLCISIVRK